MILYQKLINIPRMTKIVKESSVMQIKRAEYRSQNAEVRRQKSEAGNQKLKVKSKKSEFIKSMSFRAKSHWDERGISFYLLSFKDEISRRYAPRNDKLFLVGIVILIIGLSLTGCTSQRSKSYDQSTMITYAELTLLYEKEKMVNKQTDSSYVIKVNEFFASKGLQQNEFKKRIETISKDEEEWKIFIQDVSTTMDSLKNVGITK